MTIVLTILSVVSLLMPASFHHTQENKVERAECLRPFYEKLDRGKQPVRILHLGDSHVRGHVFSVVARRQLEEAWGSAAVEPQEISYRTTALATETGKAGLVYHAIGINGARYAHFNTPAYLGKVKELQPDLIILSFGTNEAQGTYSEAAHREEMGALVEALRKQCPTAQILLTTPPGAYRTLRIRHRRNGKTYYTYQRQANPNTPKVCAVLRSYAEEKGLPVWDLYTIVGGQQYGLRNWTSAGMMRKDRIHYTDAGYTLMGHLLAEALIKARETNDKK